MLQDHRRRREGRDPAERPAPRRARRRRQTTPWLQRNALSVAAVAVLVAVLSLGFSLLQALNRPDAGPALPPVAQAESSPTAVTAALVAASVGQSVAVPALGSATVLLPASDAPRPITSNMKALDPNYTIVSGDTLNQIAAKFNTSVERIQGFNNLPDPRSLRVGTKLVIPPPL